MWLSSQWELRTCQRLMVYHFSHPEMPTAVRGVHATPKNFGCPAWIKPRTFEANPAFSEGDAQGRIEGRSKFGAVMRGRRPEISSSIRFIRFKRRGGNHELLKRIKWRWLEPRICSRHPSCHVVTEPRPSIVSMHENKPLAGRDARSNLNSQSRLPAILVAAGACVDAAVGPRLFTGGKSSGGLAGQGRRLLNPYALLVPLSDTKVFILNLVTSRARKPHWVNCSPQRPVGLPTAVCRTCATSATVSPLRSTA